jgi:hypothetical protein
MTRLKLIGNILLWALRLALILLGPTLVVLLFGFITLLPTRPIYLACLVSAILTALYIYYGLTCNLAFPLQRAQTDRPNLKKWGMLWLGASGFLLAFCTALQWLHSGPARDSTRVGLRLFFINTETFAFLLLLSGLCLLFLFALLIKSIVKNATQLRFVTSLMAMATGLFSLAGIVMIGIDDSRTPEWQIKQTYTGTDRNTYFFLRKNVFYRDNVLTALAQQTASNPFYATVKVIIFDKNTGNFTGALQLGSKADDNEVRQVCEAMLKVEKEGRE